jgi:hypothetical protein
VLSQTNKVTVSDEGHSPTDTGLCKVRITALGFTFQSETVASYTARWNTENGWENSRA